MSNASALVNSTDAGWYAGVRDVPVGPLTRAELSTRLEAGDVTADTLVWREGLDDWRPLRSVEELSDLVRAASQKMSDGLMGSLGRRDRAGSTGATVVPIDKARGPAKSGTEGTGFEEDGEPTRMRSLEDMIAQTEVPSKGRPSADASSSRSPMREAPPPPAPAEEKKPLVAVLPPPNAALPVASPAAPPANALQAAPLATAPAATASSPAPEARPSPAPMAMVFAPASATPAPTSAAPAAPAIAASAAPSFAPIHLPLAHETPTAAPARPATPVGMYVMMAGVLFVGVAVGVVVSRKSGPAPVTTPTAVAPVRPSATASEVVPTRTVGVEIGLQPEPTASAAAPSSPPSAAPIASAEPAPSGSDRGTGRHRDHNSATGASPRASSPPVNAALAAQLAMAESQAGGRMPMAAPPATSQLRGSEAAEQTQGPTGAARAQQVLSVLNRSNVVNSCWTAAQRRNPAHPPESIVVNIDVSNTGRPNGVRVSGASDNDLATCIQSRARAQPYGPGEALGAEARYTLSRNE